MKAAERLYILSATNITHNLANLDAYKRGLSLLVMYEKQAAVIAELNRNRCWPHPPDEEEFYLWEAQYDKILDRYRTLILDGGTGMGKTKFCEYYFGDRSKMVVLNCDGDLLPDISEFDHAQGHLGNPHILYPFLNFESRMPL